MTYCGIEVSEEEGGGGGEESNLDANQKTKEQFGTNSENVKQIW